MMQNSTYHISLHKLFEAIGQHAAADSEGVTVTGVTADSRAVRPGMVFVAVRGTVSDGHRYIPQAVEAGAVAVVAEEAVEADVPVCVVPDSARALGLLASAFYGYPSAKLTLVGVTGTNGKTTIATLLYEMARFCGQKAGLLSTVANRINDTVIPSTHTTPDPVQLNELLARMVEEGCTFAAMEVSSHAAAQKRIAGLQFDGGIFTNLTRDHLDYHKTVEAYRDAKKSFFDMLPAGAWALTNADDRNGAFMLQNTGASQHTYSISRSADFRGRVMEERLDGMLMTLDGTELEVRLTGRFNASNITAVYGAWRLLGHAQMDTLLNISRLEPVAGRFQTVSHAGITAVVDYAHTPDALVNVLDTIADVMGRGVRRGAGRIITVCGCGGDRDAGKRPIMAAEAAQRSDMLIITSDNPRTEDPQEIINQMLAGLDPADSTVTTLVNVDRAQAIRTAVTLAQPGDVILVAGKGHEDYQIIGTEKHHFDDRLQIIQAFNDLKK